MLLLVCGVLLKASLVVGWRIARNETAFKIATVYDPVSFWLAELGVRLGFDQRRIAPSPLESLTFEMLLILGFALQCFVLGMILSDLRPADRACYEPGTRFCRSKAAKLSVRATPARQPQ